MHLTVLTIAAIGSRLGNAAALLVVLLLLLIMAGMKAAPTPFSARRKRRGIDPSMRPTPEDIAPAFSVVANKLRCTFTSPFSIDGIPHVAASGGAHTGTEYPTSCTVVTSLVFDLGYAHNVAAADVIAYPAHDPAVRFASGAYVQAKNATL